MRDKDDTRSTYAHEHLGKVRKRNRDENNEDG